MARRLGGETAGLLAATLLTLSPYFLPYRRLGMCEAGGAFLALLTIWHLLRSAEQVEGAPAARRSWQLGLLCGLAFGLNTRTLLLLPAILCWRTWLCRASGNTAVRPGSAAVLPQAARVIAGFALLILLYQLPYWLLGATTAGFGLHLESYLQQLERFSAGQRSIGGVGPVLAYGASGFFLLYNEGPAVLLFLYGLFVSLRAADWRRWLLPSLFVLPLVQTALLVPYARYQSWLLPLVAIIGALGLTALAEQAQSRRRGGARLVLVLSLLVLVCFAGYRGGPVIGAHSRHLAALQWCREHGARNLVESNLSAALGHAPVYRLENLWALPVDPRAAAAAVRHFPHPASTMVVLDTQQFMNAEFVMTVEQYRQSAAGILRAEGHPPCGRPMTIFRVSFPSSASNTTAISRRPSEPCEPIAPRPLIWRYTTVERRSACLSADSPPPSLRWTSRH